VGLSGTAGAGRSGEWFEPDESGVQEAYMAVTKDDIVARIHEVGFTKKQSVDLVEMLIEIIKGNLEKSEDVLVSGFGKFCVKRKNQRRGRNPATGEDLMLRQRRVITFKCSGKLRNKINGLPE
jgi:integration host factor subunit alpha